MKFIGYAAVVASIVLASSLPAKATPLAGLHYLVGSWKCTYRAGTVVFPYDAAYTYDLGGRELRESATWTGGGDEQLIAYDAKHAVWSLVVFDDQGSATSMRATSSDLNHFAYNSVYPDANIAERFDHISATEYQLRAKYRAHGKAINSVDTCLRTAS